ncbi:MAG: TPM domain-containing protein [Pyrinomonadaceae bacterium]
MKKIKFFPKSAALLIVLLFCIAIQTSFSQETKPFSISESPLPAPTAPVNDFAGAIDDNVEQQLNQKIKDFKARTNPPVTLAVAVVKTTGDRDIFDYSLAVARGWKVGSKDADNPSALLFIAIDDRKYFTQVSRDLEDELPDGVVGQLQRQYLVPAFKQGDYTKGVADTIDAYIRTIDSKQSGVAVPTPETAGKTTQTQGKRSGFNICGILPCLVILFIIFAIISRFGKSRRGRNDRNRWGGGGFGGGSVLPWVIGSVIANSIGNSSSGGSDSSSSDWGGGSSGGSSGGDWGGFGGGGDFGGGGAGGDW